MLLLLFLDSMEDMLELEDILPTLLELFILPSVKLSQDICMEDMVGTVLDMLVLDMVMDLGFTMDRIILQF